MISTPEPAPVSVPTPPVATMQSAVTPQPATPVQSAAAAVQEPLSKKAAAQAVAEQTAAVTAEIAENMAAGEQEYAYPPVSLLHESRGENHMAAGAELRNNSRRLAETLSSFGVDARAGDVIHGPSVTRYELDAGSGGASSPRSPTWRTTSPWHWGPAGVRIAAMPRQDLRGGHRGAQQDW